MRTSRSILRGPSLPLTRILHHDYPLTPQIWGLLERERFDVLVIGGWSLMAPQLAIVWARVRRTPYLLVSENHLREERPAWVRAVKSLVLRRVDPAGEPGTSSPAPSAASTRCTTARGPTASRCSRTRSTFRRTAQPPSGFDRRREEIRRALGIAHDAVAIAQVGRLSVEGARRDARGSGEGPRILEQPLHLLLVGDGELRPSLEQPGSRGRST